MNRSIYWRLAQTGLAVVFVFAGVMKLRDPGAFAASVATFRVLPRSWSNLVAIGLPPLEILCGILLFVKEWQRGAALGAALLNFIFIALLGQGLFRGLDLDCGCFGKWDPIAGHPSIAILRDALLLGASIFLYRRLYLEGFERQKLDMRRLTISSQN